MAVVRSVMSVSSVGLMVLMALSGCGGGDGNGEVVGTAGPSAASSSTASDGGSATSRPDSSDHPNPDSGKYIPATPEHPARNVPVPVMPEEAKRETTAGAKAFLNYWATTVNYLVQTGDRHYLEPIMTRDNDQFTKVMENYERFYKEGKWSVGTVQELRVESEKAEKDIQGFWRLTVVLLRTDGAIYGASGKYHDVQGDGDDGKPLEAYLTFDDSGWKLRGFEAIG